MLGLLLQLIHLLAKNALLGLVVQLLLSLWPVYLVHLQSLEVVHVHLVHLATTVRVLYHQQVSLAHQELMLVSPLHHVHLVQLVIHVRHL